MSSQKPPSKPDAELNHPFELTRMTETRQASFCVREVLVGSKLRVLRHEQGFSIRQLAEKCGISTNTLSLIENNRTSPSVHTLNLLASGLGVPVVTFFEEEKTEPELVYQQNGQRQLIRFNNGTLEKLGQGLPPLGAEPILVTLEAERKNSEEVSHAGREFIFCLEGRMTCTIGGQAYVLSPGDSLLFDASAPHTWENVHPGATKLLVLFCLMEAQDQPAERHLDH